jgi:hypothetical protein
MSCDVRYAVSQLEIIRRIAERGLKFSQDNKSECVDLFQHILDELERIKLKET